MKLIFNIRFPDKETLIDRMFDTSFYKDLSIVYPESAEKTIRLVAGFFANREFASNYDFRSEVNEKLAELINSEALKIKDILEEGSITDAVSRALAKVTLDLKSNVDAQYRFNSRLAQTA